AKRHEKGRVCPAFFMSRCNEDTARITECRRDACDVIGYRQATKPEIPDRVRHAAVEEDPDRAQRAPHARSAAPRTASARQRAPGPARAGQGRRLPPGRG